MLCKRASVVHAAHHLRRLFLCSCHDGWTRQFPPLFASYCSWHCTWVRLPEKLKCQWSGLKVIEEEKAGVSVVICYFSPVCHVNYYWRTCIISFEQDIRKGSDRKQKNCNSIFRYDGKPQLAPKMWNQLETIICPQEMGIGNMYIWEQFLNYSFRINSLKFISFTSLSSCHLPALLFGDL